LSPEDLHKVHLHRGRSEDMIPRFEDESFDIMYIDGNHAKRYVVEDAMQSTKKIKKGGWIIFDDMQDREVNEGVQLFLSMYAALFEGFVIQNAQLFIRKK